MQHANDSFFGGMHSKKLRQVLFQSLLGNLPGVVNSVDHLTQHIAASSRSTVWPQAAAQCGLKPQHSVASNRSTVLPQAAAQCGL